MKVHHIFLVIIFLSVTKCVCAEPYLIGGILPLTGDVASLGKATQNGMHLAYESFPDEIKNKFQLVFEDDQQKPSNAVACVSQTYFTEQYKSYYLLVIINMQSYGITC